MRSLSSIIIFLLSIIIILLLISCSNERDKSVSPLENEYEGSRMIYLSDHSNFGTLRDEVYRANCLEDVFPISIRSSVKSKNSIPILPPECRNEIVCYKERNVLVLKQVSDFNHDSLIAHVLNEGLLNHHAVSPREAVVFLDLEDDTSIDDFKLLCDDLINTYTSIWEGKSKAIYGLPFNSLSKEQLDAIKEQYPIYVKFFPVHL